MLKSFLSLFLLAFIIGAKAPDANAQVTNEFTLNFAVDDHRPTTESLVQLQKFLNEYSVDDDLSIRIYGHTDTNGDAAYNDELSWRRCTTVKDEILAIGFPENAISTVAYGEHKPAQNDHSPAAHRTNRRVEVHVEKHTFNTTEELTAALSPDEVQQFSIDADEPAKITSGNGIIFDIPENAFVDAAGRPYKGEVIMEVEDALDPIKFISSNLSTLNHQGEMLESGGMFRIEATDPDGNPLQLSASSSIGVDVPVRNALDGMSVFTSGDGSNWTNTSRPVDLNQPPVYPPKPTYPGEAVFVHPPVPKIPEAPRKPAIPYRPVNPEKQEITQVNDLNIERYLRAMEVFKRDSASYPDRIDQYRQDSLKWAAEKHEMLETYHKVTVPAAHEEWKKTFIDPDRAYQLEMTRWRAKCELISIEHYGSLLDNDYMDARMLGTYALRVSSLGWCNIDRLMRYGNNERIDVLVQADDPNAQLWLVLNDYPSMFNMGAHKGVAEQSNFPYVPAEAIALTVKDGEVMFGHAPLTRDGKVTIETRPSSLEEIRDYLSQFRTGALQASR